MKKATGYYLIAIGTLEIVVYLVRESVPEIALPHFGLLWLSFFADSGSKSMIASLGIGVLVITAGVGLLTNRRYVAIPYCVVGGLVALVDIYDPLAALLFGGHFVGPALMVPSLLALLLYDGVPVLMAVSMVLNWDSGHGDSSA
jgi:hypothetical protein